MSKTSPAPTTASTFANWSVIVQSDLASSYIGQQLRQKDVKVKRAESVLEGSVIFPRSKVAFMVLELTKQLLSHFSNSKHVSKLSTSSDKNSGCSRDTIGLKEICVSEKSGGKKDGAAQEDAKNEYTAVLARLDKFTRIHRHCYILLQAPLFTEKELAFLYHLQTRYLEITSVDILTGHSAEECVSAMLTISSLQTPPTSDKLHQRFCQCMTELVEPLPMETLTKIAQSDNC